MTATITPPPNVPFLNRVDPKVRLNDYARALDFYLQTPEHQLDRIVFFDNSASDIELLEDVSAATPHRKDVELISYDGLHYPVEQGRSVGETLLIRDALDQSRILGSLEPNSLFWKVTGRLRVRNIVQLTSSTPHGCSLYVDFRRYRAQLIDTRFFAVSPDAFRRLFLDRLELLRQDTLPGSMASPEERLFWELLPHIESERIAPRLRYEPWLEGHSGFGEDYRRLRRRIESRIRAGTRRVAPRLWI